MCNCVWCSRRVLFGTESHIEEKKKVGPNLKQNLRQNKMLGEKKKKKCGGKGLALPYKQKDIIFIIWSDDRKHKGGLTGYV
jgi:hypothetical protein